MAKIPFSIKYRPQIESGEYKVENMAGFPVTILDWCYNGCQIIAKTKIKGEIEGELKDYVRAYTQDGGLLVMGEKYDDVLSIITPEPERSEFEKVLYGMIGNKVYVKEYASRLLSIARKEIDKKPKPVVWSEEDLQHKSWILECLADGERKMPKYAEDFRAAYKWLKFLCPQPKEELAKMLQNEYNRGYKEAEEYHYMIEVPHWKPSEEQMNVLRGVMASLCKIGIDDENLKVLQNLYNDLTKLM